MVKDFSLWKPIGEVDIGKGQLFQRPVMHVELLQRDHEAHILATKHLDGLNQPCQVLLRRYEASSKGDYDNGVVAFYETCNLLIETLLDKVRIEF
jgi:hypothetical protein